MATRNDRLNFELGHVYAKPKGLGVSGVRLAFKKFASLQREVGPPLQAAETSGDGQGPDLGETAVRAVTRNTSAADVILSEPRAERLPEPSP